MTGCFGWDLCPDYKEKIQLFKSSLVKLRSYCSSKLKMKFTITWKLHMICCHLEPLLTRLGHGLAIYCEQAGEAVHCKMKKTKARYKRNVYHANHGKAQLNSVVNWSSWNLYSINKSTINRYRQNFKQKRKIGV